MNAACKIVGLLATLLAWSSLPASAQSETLTLSTINDDIRKHIERFTPLARYLESELADEGVTEVAIAVLPDTRSVVEAMRSGEVDLFFDSPLVAARVARLADAAPFLRRWKDGVATYHSAIVVPTDSSIADLEDLRGTIFGFQDSESTSGYLLPMAMLLEAGLTLEHLREENTRPVEDVVGYVFTGHDRSTAVQLVRGTIDAGATDDEGVERLQGAQPGRYRVLARSIEVPRSVVVRRAGLDEMLLNAIADTLRTMTETEVGLTTLEAFDDTMRFDDFPGGVEATFAPINAVLDRLDDRSVI